MQEKLTHQLCFVWFFFRVGSVEVTSKCSKQHTAGDGGWGWARDGVYPQVRPACRASRGARWPRCQQAGPGLIKDVEPNWSCQHLLPLHLGGWRRSSAQYAHRRSDLEERHGQTLHTKKVNGMNGDQRNLSASKDISTMASVSDIKWTVHSLSINIAVVSLSVPHCCRLFVFFASTRA